MCLSAFVSALGSHEMEHHNLPIIIIIISVVDMISFHFQEVLTNSSRLSLHILYSSMMQNTSACHETEIICVCGRGCAHARASLSVRLSGCPCVCLSPPPPITHRYIPCFSTVGVSRTQKLY